MDNKTELINTVLYSMIEELDKEQLCKLKSQLQLALYDYNISKMETTEISIGDCNTTRELLEYFSVCKLSSGRSQKTIKQYLLVAKQLCDFTNRELNTITSEDVIYFLAAYPHSKDKMVSGCTMDSKRRYLSSIFTLLKKHKKIAENPMDMVDRIKFTSKIKVPLNDKEINDINVAINKTKNKITKVRNEAIIQLCFDTGVRVSELTNIDIADIDFYKKEIKVLGKNSKERIVMFSNDTENKIKSYLKLRSKNNDIEYDKDSPLFMDISCKNRLKPSGVQSMMKRLRKSSGVNRLHPHLIRCTTSCKLANRGIQIDVISKYLGHSGLDVVQRYVTNSQERMRKELYKVGLG